MPKKRMIREEGISRKVYIQHDRTSTSRFSTDSHLGRISSELTLLLN